MGKRIDFKRRPQDAYDTPPEAVAPLVPHLLGNCTFWEPCAGAGHLVTELVKAGNDCLWASDIAPRTGGMTKCNALLQNDISGKIDYIITNPPWERRSLHAMIEHFSDMRPTWLLFDADWMHTKQAAPYMPRLRKIVSVGRVKWIPESPYTGKDNCCWYLFTTPADAPAEFYGRTP